MIGQRCKCSNVCSLLILIDRGLDQGYHWISLEFSFESIISNNMVTIARRIHLFPFRTQKLSSLALKVLGGKLPGRIGRSHVKCRSGGTGRRTGLKILRNLYFRTGSIPLGVIMWEYSSAGRASALQAGGHRFEPCYSHQ